jgi:hypothetical protein
MRENGNALLPTYRSARRGQLYQLELPAHSFNTYKPVAHHSVLRRLNQSTEFIVVCLVRSVHSQKLYESEPSEDSVIMMRRTIPEHRSGLSHFGALWHRLLPFAVIIFLLTQTVASPAQKPVRRVLIFNDFGSISSPDIALIDQAIAAGLATTPYQIETIRRRGFACPSVVTHGTTAGTYIITMRGHLRCHHEDRNCHRDGAVARETMYTVLSLLSLHAQR